MIKEITITIKPKDEENQKLINSLIKKELKKIGINSNQKINSVFEKKSIDARHGQIKIHLRYKIYIDEDVESSLQTGENNLPLWQFADGKKSVIIIGFGPAGIFGALELLEKGIKPIILERGEKTFERKKDIALISTKNFVNEDSNYCFGEGGAGTFSDGKLYTRSNKRGNINKILQIFVHFGAEKKILTDAHPHIGTDKLPTVINNIRNKIIELGGEIHFNTKVTDFIIENKTLVGVKTKNTHTNEEAQFFGNAFMLSTGHSASDIYKIIAKINPSSLEAKTFAVGVRVEHPRELIDKIQYKENFSQNLGAAEYRVTTQIQGRGVYSFCMCPGGFVVPSSSGPDEIVVNGMSAAKRNSKWSNAAIVVETRFEDIPQKFVDMAKKENCTALAGLFYRTELERLAKQNGNGQSAPAQRLPDFLKNKKSTDFPPTSFTPGIVSSNLNDWLPSDLCSKLKEGFYEINKKMKGFICDDAVMIAIETRTSTPVRILRNKETFECEGIKNLFPSGEGSGYSGGIVSSAMDGEKVCKSIISHL